MFVRVRDFSIRPFRSQDISVATFQYINNWLYLFVWMII